MYKFILIIFIFILNSTAFSGVVILDIGTEGKTYEDSKLNLRLLARFQKYNKSPEDESDIYDREVYSPKSVAFHPNNRKVYVNSLEGYKTLVYSWSEDDREMPKKIKSIEHKFDSSNEELFRNEKTLPAAIPEILLCLAKSNRSA